MMESHYISAAEEKALLEEWFETVHFDEESEGIPPLKPERDDEESRNHVDAASIVDWFNSPPGTQVPLSSGGSDFVFKNHEAWKLVDWRDIGMGIQAGKTYMEKEARFLELYGQFRGNPYHDKAGKFASKSGPGGATAVMDAPDSGPIGASTRPKRTSTRVSNSVVDERVGELQRKEPDKYWKVAETHEGAQSYKLSNPDGTTAGHYALYNRTDHVEFGTLAAEPGQKGIAKSALDDLDARVPDKVQRLDAFDGDLTSIYSKYGFKETDRVKWDDQYAPSSWKPEYGRPDVVFMERPSAVDRGVTARSHPF